MPFGSKALNSLEKAYYTQNAPLSTNRQTDRPADRVVHREVTYLKIHYLFMICMFVNKCQCLRPEWMAKQLEMPSSVDLDAIHGYMGALLSQNNY